MARALFVLMLALSFSKVYAATVTDQPTCPEIVDRKANIQLQRLYSNESQSCFLTITPRKNLNLLYRDFLLSSDGLLMVFNSFGDGEGADQTGAREFYFYPHINTSPTYVWNDKDRRLEVTHTNGDILFFDYDSAQIIGSAKGQVTVASEIKKENRGGVEILNYKGFMIDAGFALGKSPSAVGAATATLKDSGGETCDVQNKELFKFTSTDDIILIYDDQGLISFLKNRCPKLNYP